jgi:hypothetical protein
MRRWIAVALFAGLGAWPCAALAARELGEFKAPAEMTPEELERSKTLNSNVNPYANQITEQVSPIPWKTIGLFALILAVATPYGLRYYRSTAGWGEDKPAKRRSARNPPPRNDEAPAPAPSGGSGKGWANDETRVRSAPSQPQSHSQDNTRVPIRRNTRP